MKTQFKMLLNIVVAMGLLLMSSSALANVNGSGDKSNSSCVAMNSPFEPYELNYILPYSYNSSNKAYDEIFDHTANKKYEVKFQISAQTPIIRNIFHKPLSLNVFYTQVSYWQFYATSAYFRESNYNPGFFLHLQPQNKHPFRLFSVDVGAMHQSNGRGATYERSWNRVFMNLTFHLSPSWGLSLRPWYRVNVLEAKNYNPDLVHYLGDGDLRVNYRKNNFAASLMLRNEFESGFSRGAEELDISFPFYSYFHGFVQVFSGYGQSLIAYNHYSNSAGVGISLFSQHTPST
jgi:phospholipase A1